MSSKSFINSGLRRKILSSLKSWNGSGWETPYDRVRQPLQDAITDPTFPLIAWHDLWTIVSLQWFLQTSGGDDGTASVQMSLASVAIASLNKQCFADDKSDYHVPGTRRYIYPIYDFAADSTGMLIHRQPVTYRTMYQVCPLRHMNLRTFARSTRCWLYLSRYRTGSLAAMCARQAGSAAAFTDMTPFCHRKILKPEMTGKSMHYCCWYMPRKLLSITATKLLFICIIRKGVEVTDPRGHWRKISSHGEYAKF